MHVTGAEKTLAAQPAQEVLVAAAVVSDGDDDLFGTDYFLTDFERGRIKCGPAHAGDPGYYLPSVGGAGTLN